MFVILFQKTGRICKSVGQVSAVFRLVDNCVPKASLATSPKLPVHTSQRQSTSGSTNRGKFPKMSVKETTGRYEGPPRVRSDCFRAQLLRIKDDEVQAAKLAEADKSNTETLIKWNL